MKCNYPDSSFSSNFACAAVSGNPINTQPPQSCAASPCTVPPPPALPPAPFAEDAEGAIARPVEELPGLSSLPSPPTPTPEAAEAPIARPVKHLPAPSSLPPPPTPTPLLLAPPVIFSASPAFSSFSSAACLI